MTALDTTFTVTGDHADYHEALHLHYNRWQDVMDLGATGDGSTDDTVAIQAAITAAASASHVVYFPAGTYRTTAKLAVAEAMTFIGQGDGRINGEISAIMNDNNDHAIHVQQVGVNRPFEMRDMMVYDNLSAANRTTGAGIRIERTVTTGNCIARLKNVWVEGHDDGIVIVRPVMSSLESVWVQGCESDGITLVGTADGGGTTTTATNCFVSTAGQYGWVVSDMSYSSFRCCGADGSGSHGWYVYRQNSAMIGNVFTACGAETNGGDGMNVEQALGLCVLGGHFPSNSSDGIEINNSDAVFIAGMSGQSNTGYGINIATAGGNVVHRMFVTSCWLTGNTAGEFNDPNSLAIFMDRDMMTRVRGISLTTTQPGINNLRGQDTFAAAATKAVTFGSAEPDASYFVTIGGNANETFWVTNKATTGFTLNSSNAGSVAVVDWIVIR